MSVQSIQSSAEDLLVKKPQDELQVPVMNGKSRRRSEEQQPAAADESGPPESSGVSSCSSMSNLGNPELLVEEESHLSWWGVAWRVGCVLLLLYTFICSLDLLSGSFRLLGGETAGKVFAGNKAINNPVGGLMIGVLVTVLVQSSSTSSSIVVAMVASSILTVPTAVPLIMGANIGTSVTNTIVALSQIQDGDMFERSFAAATVHDMFNVLTVICLLPAEVITGFLVTISDKMVSAFNLPQTDAGQVETLSLITDPLTDRIVLVDKSVIGQIAKGIPLEPGQQLLKRYCDDVKHVVTSQVNMTSSNVTDALTSLANATVTTSEAPVERERCKALFNLFNWSDSAAGAVLLLLSLVALFSCLVLLVKILQSIFQGHISKVINKTVNADFPGCFGFLTGYVAILVGVVMTILVQSSSIFTSTLTPLVGLKIITLERAFPLTLGSNIGTTITSMLAALASEGSNFRYALQISFCHLLFNVLGILIWFPTPYLRRLPLACARQLGKTTNKYRWFSFTYILMMFFVLPGVVFGLSYAGTVYIMTFVGLVGVVAFLVALLKFLQHHWREKLPVKLQDFKFLPVYFRSLEPYDRFLTGWYRRMKTTQIQRIRRVTESSMGLAQDEESQLRKMHRRKKYIQKKHHLNINVDIGVEATENYGKQKQQSKKKGGLLLPDSFGADKVKFVKLESKV